MVERKSGTGADFPPNVFVFIC